MSTARKLVRTVALLLTVASMTRAQRSPLIAGWSPAFEGGVGYSYLRSDVPSEGTLGMNGILLSGTADFSPYFGLKAELGYSRSFDAFQSGRTADLFTYMGGPVFYPIRRRKFNIYAQALFGGARETGINFESDGTVIRGFVNHFAWGAGAGIQFSISPALSVRAGADYLRTSFFDSTMTVQSQSNVRTAVSVVYRFGRHE